MLSLLLIVLLQQQQPVQHPVQQPAQQPAPQPSQVPSQPTVVVPAPIAAPAPPLELAPSTARVVTNPIAPVDDASTVVPPNAAMEEEVHARIQDLVEIDGVRENQIQGFGLVTGLNHTGDKGNAAKQALANFVKNNDMNVAVTDLNIGNVALVSVTATLPPFRKAGTRINVAVQSINGAESLFGGFLLQTPLLANVDHEVYVVAQGPVTVGGFTAAGKAASVVQNHPTSGLVTEGGLVEREVPMHMLAGDGAMYLHLRSPNYVSAMRVAKEIGRTVPGARAVDAATIRVEVPIASREDVVAFWAELGEHTITPGDDAVVVVNERTGTVVAGFHVRISTTMITHGNLTISIAESEQPSQPQPFSDGTTTTVPRTDLTAQQDQRPLQVVKGSTSVSELAASLNRLGVGPRDLVAIFQALAQAGALHARLEIL